MMQQDIENMIGWIKRRCERPSPVIHVENYHACERGFTIQYGGGSLAVKPGYHVSFQDDALVVRATSKHEVDPSVSFKKALLSGLAKGLADLAAPEHRIRWQSISGMFDSPAEGLARGEVPTEARHVCRPSGTKHDLPSIPSSVEERIVRIVIEHLSVEKLEVTPNASFADDLGADSLDQVELVMAAEEDFAIEIPDEDAEKIRTVQDAIDYIEKRMGAGPAVL